MGVRGGDENLKEGVGVKEGENETQQLVQVLDNVSMVSVVNE